MSVILLLYLLKLDLRNIWIVISSYLFMCECILFVLTVSMTNPILGPIISFIRHSKSMNSTDVFRVRDGDYFSELEEIAKK